VIGNYAFVAGKGLVVVDVSNPASPVVKRTVEVGKGKAVFMGGDQACYLDYTGTLDMLDTSSCGENEPLSKNGTSQSYAANGSDLLTLIARDWAAGNGIL